MKNHLIQPLIVSLLSMTFVVNADVLVSWGEADDIVTGSKTMNEGSPSKSVNFSSYVNPAPSYYPNDTGKTPYFYGQAYRVLQSTTDANPTETISDANWRLINASPDYFYASNNGPADTTTNNYWHSYIWQKEDFLSGGDTAPTVSLSGMSIRTGDNGSGVNTSVRFIIELYDSAFYISESFGEGTQSFTDPTTVAWQNYDPTVDFSDFTGSAASLSASDFENLTSAGAVVQALSSGRYVQSRVYGMEVQGVAIPEAGSIALLSLGLLVMIPGIRRKLK